jgi:DNA polymerase I-like protein with 3'-5' exonuclease and polymerase domains
MEHEGIDIDLVALDKVGKQLKSKNMNEEDDLYVHKCLTKEDNLSSTADLIDILYTRDGGFELYPPDRTAKGKPSVSAPTLKLLLEQIEQELKDRE